MAPTELPVTMLPRTGTVVVFDLEYTSWGRRRHHRAVA
jgi:hypothetical protein